MSLSLANLVLLGRINFIRSLPRIHPPRLVSQAWQPAPDLPLLLEPHAKEHLRAGLRQAGRSMAMAEKAMLEGVRSSAVEALAVAVAIDVGRPSSEESPFFQLKVDRRCLS